MAQVEVAKARRDIRDAEVSVPKQHLRHRDTMLLNELPDGVPACLRSFRKTDSQSPVKPELAYERGFVSVNA